MSFQTLTAFYRNRGGLQTQESPSRLGDVHAEGHPHASVFAADVCLSFPEFDVRIPQLQDSRTVNAVVQTSEQF